MTSLPDINQKQNATEITYRRNSLTPSNSEDSLVDKRSSGRSACSSEGREKLLYPSGGTLLTPSPPPGQPGLLNRPKTSIGIRRPPVDYIYMSRIESDKREQVLANLRSDVICLQSQIRELQRYKQDYTALQSMCEGVGRAVGAAVQGCDASTVHDILLARIQTVLQEQQEIAQQNDSCLSDLEQCQGELAAAKLQLSLAESDLVKTKGQNDQLESELKQSKSELETLQLTCARTGASVSSLRHQLSLAKEKAGKESQETSSEVVQLQTDIGILRRKLAEKEDELRGVELSVSAMKEDQEGLSGRLVDAEAMYMDLGLQLAQILQIETEESFDPEDLLKQIRTMTSERDELALKCTRLESTIKTAEMDTQASRETILRLVSENKKHSREGEELEKVQEELGAQKDLLRVAAKEKEDLQQRLVASRETIGAMEKELHGKDRKVSELARTLESFRDAANSIKSRSGMMETKYEELVRSVRTALVADSDEPEELMEKAQSLIQNCSELSEQLTERALELETTNKELQITRATSSQLQEELELEKEKVERLEGELEAAEVVKDGLQRDLERSRTFCKKIGRAVGMEQETEAILVAGDFAHDAILMKAEQLAKQESESLINKQTALYSMQRKLKACRQSLESKTLQLGLVQRKLEGLEERLKGSGQKEAEWEAATTRARSLERQLDRLQGKVSEQRDTISQLKMDSSQLQRLKEYCQKLEEEQGTLVAKKDHMEETLTCQSQQLSEMRQKVRQKQSVSSKELEEVRSQLELAQEDRQRLLEVEAKLSSFRSSVHQLLSNQDLTLADGSSSNITDFDLMTSLEKLLASHEKHRNTAKCLEASLRQLEQGFKNNYKDTLTLLNSD